MTATKYLRFYGYYYLTYQEVQVTIGGLDCGDFIVDSVGSVIVPIGGDPQGLLTFAFLKGLDGYTGEQAAEVSFDDGGGLGVLNYVIPVVIGQKYTYKTQLLRAISQEDLKMPEGAGIGRTRRAHSVGLYVTNTISGFKVGTDFADTLHVADLRLVDSVTVLDALTPFSGVWWDNVESNDNFDSMLAVQQDRPSPITVAAVTVYQEGEPR